LANFYKEPELCLAKRFAILISNNAMKFNMHEIPKVTINYHSRKYIKTEMKSWTRTEQSMLNCIIVVYIEKAMFSINSLSLRRRRKREKRKMRLYKEKITYLTFLYFFTEVFISRWYRLLDKIINTHQIVFPGFNHPLLVFSLK